MWFLAVALLALDITCLPTTATHLQQLDSELELVDHGNQLGVRALHYLFLSTAAFGLLTDTFLPLLLLTRGNRTSTLYGSVLLVLALMIPVVTSAVCFYAIDSGELKNKAVDSMDFYIPDQPTKDNLTTPLFVENPYPFMSSTQGPPRTVGSVQVSRIATVG